MTTGTEAVTVSWQWQPAGAIRLASDGLLVLPSLPAIPGAYRLTLSDAGGECIGLYIGQGGSLRQRIQHYRTPGFGHRDTKTRVNGLLLAALRSGGAVKVEIATAASSMHGDQAFQLDLGVEASRRLVENAALTVAYASGLPVLNGGYGAASPPAH